MRLRAICWAITLGCLAAPPVAAQPRGEPFLLRASTHPIRYYLSLPEDFDPDSRKYPVLVCVAGAGSDFPTQLERFREARGRAPFLLVVPCTFANTNALEGPRRFIYRGLYTADVIQDAERGRLEWDEAGLLAILADLRRDFGADDRIVITGFSGGGLLTYRMLLSHPELVAAAAPVCPNYFGDTGSAETPLTAGEAATPVRILLGEFDQLLGGGRAPGEVPRPRWIWVAMAAIGLGVVFLLVQRKRLSGRIGIALSFVILGVAATCVVKARPNDLIDPQTRAAVRQLETRGFANVTVTVVPELGHTGMPARVVEGFKQVVGD